MLNALKSTGMISEFVTNAQLFPIQSFQIALPVASLISYTIEGFGGAGS
jgi:hypothetical protein